jgi:hypothetical protein
MRIALAVAAVVVAVGGCSKKEETSNAAASASALSALTQPPAPSGSAFPQGPFEGEIVVTVKDETGQKLPASITYDVKGDKVRYEPASTALRAIGDLAAQHAYAFDATQKAYRELDTRPSANLGKVAVQAKVAKTGKMEKVAGSDCEDWTIDAIDEKADVCAAKGIAYFDFAGDPKPGSAEPAWAAALTKEKAFPLRVVVHDKAGKEQFRAEASTVVRKNVDDVLFQLPTGFKKAELDVKAASLP